ncbi:uncharacterized protein LOC142467325 isoform X1 [Ascaphus truei]|uniref:uncharacterized protein LOC142467325 isoform X1 n=1 Tax=Ascaphus truei TaxID=8439 RepID=UPI003F5A2BD5
MSSWKALLLFPSVICFLVAMTAAEPSCADVEDYGNCSGDPANFCPKDIGCSCKDGFPFCKCPYYKGPRADYWYIGPKCDQLWNTRDLIFVIVLPAFALACVVAVTAQCIHCCKTTRKKSRKTDGRQTERLTTNSHHNQAYVPERDANLHNMEHPLAKAISQMQQTKVTPPQNVAGFEQPRVQEYNHYEASRPEMPSVLMRNTPNLQPQTQSYEHYEVDRMTNRPESPYSKPIPKIARPVFPDADYRQDAAGQDAAEPDTNQWPDRPFVFGRPRVKNIYEY